MEYANLWRRFVAMVIDAIIVFALSIFFARTVILMPLAFIVHFFYQPIFEASNARATPGKYLAEISVVRTNGEQLSLKNAYIRYFTSWASIIFLFLGYFAAIFSQKKQALHDVMADSIVISHSFENEGLWNEWIKTVKKLFNLLMKKEN